MYEFEQNKKNNLILYGIITKHPETSESLRARVINIFKDHLNIRRDIVVVRAARIHTGNVMTILCRRPGWDFLKPFTFYTKLLQAISHTF